MRKLSLVLAVLVMLCACAFAETEAPVYAAEDFIGLWNLNYVVADGIQVSAAAYGLTVTMTVNEDESALLDYGDGNPLEMTWRFENGEAWLAGYTEEEVQMVITEAGALSIEDAVGSMCFVRPVEEAE